MENSHELVMSFRTIQLVYGVGRFSRLNMICFIRTGSMDLLPCKTDIERICWVASCSQTDTQLAGGHVTQLPQCLTEITLHARTSIT